MQSSSTAQPISISTARVWVLAIRPRTLPAAVAPVAVGTALAISSDAFYFLAAACALLVALLLQIIANLANDAFDFRRGADTAERVGPLRVTQSGLLTPRQVAVATGLAIAACVVLGLYLVARGGWPVLVLGILAIVAALAYTGGPAPLGYLGLGELFVFVFFGLVGVAGTWYVQALRMETLPLLAAIPIGCLITNILVVNNLRDVDTDRVAGKRTLAVRLGRRRSLGEFTLLLGVAYLTPPALWLGGWLAGWWWLTLLTLPAAVQLTRGVVRESGPALNRRLAGAARLALLYALALSVSILL